MPSRPVPVRLLVGIIDEMVDDALALKEPILVIAALRRKFGAFLLHEALTLLLQFGLGDADLLLNFLHVRYLLFVAAIQRCWKALNLWTPTAQQRAIAHVHSINLIKQILSSHRAG